MVKARRPGPGLSDREVEVLRLMSRGMSRKQIGSQLFIADKTVARHIEHIYDKLGVNTRPGANGLRHAARLLSQEWVT